eukprot:3665336-Pyramimonas_sp.AAC.1
MESAGKARDSEGKRTKVMVRGVRGREGSEGKSGKVMERDAWKVRARNAMKSDGKQVAGKESEGL